MKGWSEKDFWLMAEYQMRTKDRDGRTVDIASFYEPSFQILDLCVMWEEQQ